MNTLQELHARYIVTGYLNVRALCALLGVTRQTYYNWINGGINPSARHAERVEETLSRLSTMTPVDLVEFKYRGYKWSSPGN